MEDLAILESFRTGVGEKDAFDSLFRKYYPQMCVYAHRFVDMVETEDIVQECFVWIWNNRAVIVVDRSVPHYLFSMVRHRALNTIRKKNIGQKVTDMLQEIRKEDMEENAFDAQELKRRIQEAIESLPDPYSTITRPVKELKHFEKKLIPAGESCTFTFEIDPMRDLSFVNEDGERFIEPGEFRIIVGDQEIGITLTEQK